VPGKPTGWSRRPAQLAFLLTPYAVVVLMFFVASRFPVERDAESEARLQRVALDDEA
jgi:hypothetical protein